MWGFLVSLPNGDALIFNGYHIYKYITSQNKIREIQYLPEYRDEYSFICVGNYVYIFGGWGIL